MKSSHCPKYERKIWKILPWTEFSNSFVHILGNATTSYFYFEIYWPLTISERYIIQNDSKITCAIDCIIFCVYGAFIIFCINWGFSVIWDSKDCIPGDVNKALPVADPVEPFVPVVPVDVEFGAPRKREDFLWIFNL